jgi:hypothetical protein
MCVRVVLVRRRWPHELPVVVGLLEPSAAHAEIFAKRATSKRVVRKYSNAIVESLKANNIQNNIIFKPHSIIRQKMAAQAPS